MFRLAAAALKDRVLEFFLLSPSRSDPMDPMMRKIVRLIFVIFLAASPAAAEDSPGDSPDDAPTLPIRIGASAALRQHMTGMLQRSGTFREQCRRLDVGGVRVLIRRDATIVDRPYRALTTIVRTVSGEIIGYVTIGMFGDPTEWLAHEFEHLVEQVDGVRLRHLEVHSSRDVWSSNGMFETSRALRAGRLVRDEVRGYARTIARAAALETARGDD